jgi:O-antigen ligase
MEVSHARIRVAWPPPWWPEKSGVPHRVGAAIHPYRQVVRVHFTIGAALALTPLLILPGYLFYYDVTPKVAVALMGTAIALLLFLCDPGFAGAHRWWAHPLGRWYCLLAGAQLAWLLLSTFFSSHPALSWNGGNWRRFGFVSQFAVIAMGFLIVASCSESGSRVFLRTTAAAGTAAALYGILQYFGVDPFLPSASYHVGEGVAAIVRPPSTLGHADYFAGYLLYVAFGGAALLATESAPLWKALGAAAAVAGSVAIVLSGTRGALLGLAAGVVSLWIWNSAPLKKRHVVLAVGLCAAGLAFYFSPAGLKLRARGQWALEDLRGGARLWLWRDSLRMADQRLLLGFGPETFGLEFPRYQSADLSRAYPDFYHESPHNIFLDALVSEGVPGLAILAGFVTLAWFATRRAVAQGQRAAPYLAAALVAGLTAGLFVCFILPVALYFYATVAMLAGVAIPPRASVTGSRPSLRLRVPAFALGLTAIAMFLYFAVRLTASDFALGQAKRDLNAGQIADSLKAYRWSQRWHMAGSSDDLFFSRALAAASRTASDPGLALMALQQAFSVARRAAETSEERQNAWYSLAAFYATQNDATDVEACLRRSIAASPNWFQPHWALAQMLLLAGRRTEALQEAARAADLDGGKDPEIAKFLQGVHHQPASPAAE